MSVSISLNDKDLFNLQKQLDKIKESYSDTAYDMVVKLGYDTKRLAQYKLRMNNSIKTKKLHNSLFVKDRDKTDNSSYSCELGTFDADFEIPLSENEVAVGTNVEYAAAVEFGRAPRVIEVKHVNVLTDGENFFGRIVHQKRVVGKTFLYWATKHLDIEHRETELKSKLAKFNKG